MIKRKKHGFAKFVVVVVILAIIVLLGADNFGFDWFNFKIDLSKSTGQTSQDSTSDADFGYINIEIIDDVMTLNEKEMDFATLQTSLDKYPSSEYVVNLIDNWALNSTFVQVESYLSQEKYRVIVSEKVKE